MFSTLKIPCAFRLQILLPTNTCNFSVEYKTVPIYDYVKQEILIFEFEMWESEKKEVSFWWT